MLTVASVLEQNLRGKSGEVVTLGGIGSVRWIAATRISNLWVKFMILTAHMFSSATKKKALTTHIKITHLGQRDHVCPHQNCGRAYGYRHLLLRHTAKVHSPLTPDVESSSDESDNDEPAHLACSKKAKQLACLDIDTVTGNAYAKRALADIASSRALRCPYPNLSDFLAICVDTSMSKQDTNPVTGSSCEYVFSRAYDLRRHLKAAHNMNANKESVDEWVKQKKTS